MEDDHFIHQGMRAGGAPWTVSLFPRGQGAGGHSSASRGNAWVNDSHTRDGGVA